MNIIIPVMKVMWLRKKRILSLLMLLWLAVSCSTVNRSSLPVEEDKLYVTRIYVGNFLSYRHTGSDANGNPDLIWLTTTQDSIHGQISAYSKECTFTPGERLFLKRTLTTSGKSQAWVYQVENSDSLNYMINEYQDHSTALVDAWFNTLPDSPAPADSVSPVRIAQKTGDQTGKFSENK
ncbi:MAG: hypothetical protein E4G92_00890 [Bacteroidia bacterium]|nr:MAG: hypothetical protein E4G92_00890 [Bacteroidia bacterium]